MKIVLAYTQTLAYSESMTKINTEKLKWNDCSTHPKCDVWIDDDVTQYGATLPKGLRAKSAAMDYAKSYDFNCPTPPDVDEDAPPPPPRSAIVTLTDNRTGSVIRFSFEEDGKNFKWNL